VFRSIELPFRGLRETGAYGRTRLRTARGRWMTNTPARQIRICPYDDTTNCRSRTRVRYCRLRAGHAHPDAEWHYGQGKARQRVLLISAAVPFIGVIARNQRRPHAAPIRQHIEWRAGRYGATRPGGVCSRQVEPPGVRRLCPDCEPDRNRATMSRSPHLRVSRAPGAPPATSTLWRPCPFAANWCGIDREPGLGSASLRSTILPYRAVRFTFRERSRDRYRGRSGERVRPIMAQTRTPVLEGFEFLTMSFETKADLTVSGPRPVSCSRSCAAPLRRRPFCPDPPSERISGLLYGGPKWVIQHCPGAGSSA